MKHVSPKWAQVVLAIGAIVTVWAVVAFALVRVHQHWWFEDDPVLYGFGARARNAWAFFYDATLFRTEISSNEIVPLLFASFWVDGWLAPLSAKVAYLHQALAVLAAAFGLFAVSARILKKIAPAALLTVIWLVLPSTLVVLEFLSTRDYVEGLAAALVAVACAQQIAAKDRPAPLAFGIMILMSLAAVLAKEFFPTTLLLALFLILGAARRFWAASAIVAVGAFYAVYRLKFVGHDLSYGMPLLAPAEYLRFLGRVPYMITGNAFGYVLAVAVVLFCGILGLAEGAFWLAIIVASLATIYPISYAVNSAWQDHGTWYRSVFVLNTALLLLFFRIFGAIRRPVALALTGATLAAACVGGLATISTWSDMKARYSAEGRFFLSHPGQILYSDLPAPWFLPGLAKLYQDDATALVLQPTDTVAADSAVKLRETGVVWRFDGEGVRPDPELFKKLTQIRTAAGTEESRGARR